MSANGKMQRKLLAFSLLTFALCPFGYWLCSILRAILGFTGWGMVLSFPTVLVTYVCGLIGGLIASLCLIDGEGHIRLDRWPWVLCGFFGLILLIAIPLFGNPQQLAALPANLGRESLHLGGGVLVGLGLLRWLAPPVFGSDSSATLRAK